MNVFVLGTGRCGTMTFARACGHITNYTSGHETGGLAFPDWHIEVDNRLSWSLGHLAENYPDAFYVHLTRNRDDVIASFAGRLAHGLYMPIVQGIGGHGLPEETAARYVDCCNENIREFLRHRRGMTVRIEEPLFGVFWEEIGAHGNYRKALAELKVRHNAS